MGITFYGDWRASVAYWLAPEARGRGLATRSVRLLTAWAFDTFEDLVRIELWSIVGNVASDAVARRSGFSEEGLLRSRLPYRGATGTFGASPFSAVNSRSMGSPRRRGRPPADAHRLGRAVMDAALRSLP